MQEKHHIDLAKLQLLLEELKDQEIVTVGLCETRWSKEGKFSQEELRQEVLFSGNEKVGSHGVATNHEQFSEFLHSESVEWVTKL